MRYRLCLFLLLISCLGRSQAGLPVSELLKGFERASLSFDQFEWAKALVAAHDMSVLPKLEPWLTHSDRLQRGNAAFVFAGLGDPRGFETIVSILNERSERPHGQEGVYHLPRDVGADAHFVSAATIGQDRYYAAHLLGDLKDRRAVPILVKLLNDPDVNYIVPWSLGQIGDRSAIPALISVLGDENPSMRVLATYALEELGAIEALPRLRNLLDDPQRSTFGERVAVSETARDAIGKLESRPSAPARQ
jgi:HEAT repeat protein